jgi:DNA repair exonuclease SbcCD nuclease subunit
LKIAILNDTHCGVRSDMLEMSNYQGRFYDEVFFPYLDEHNIKQIVHLGDYFDRRKYVNFASLKANKKHFIEPMIKRGIHMDLILGNHDTYYKNTNDVNSPELLLFGDNNINVIAEPINKEYDGCLIALVPWINPENYADSVEFLLQNNATQCWGHFEIEGALMMPGFNCPHGLDHTYLKRFEQVLSGHFHHKSEVANIRYLGSQMEFTWSDYGDNKYFHIFDTDTRELLPVLNPITMFHKAFYDDSKSSFEEISNADYSEIEGKFVKVIVINKDNPYWFDTYLDKIHAQNPIHLQVVDDNKHMDFFNDDDIDDIEDTLTILSKYVDGLEIQGKKKHLDELMTSLYHEALEEHNFL